MEPQTWRLCKRGVVMVFVLSGGSYIEKIFQVTKTRNNLIWPKQFSTNEYGQLLKPSTTHRTSLSSSVSLDPPNVRVLLFPTSQIGQSQGLPWNQRSRDFLVAQWKLLDKKSLGICGSCCSWNWWAKLPISNWWWTWFLFLWKYLQDPIAYQGRILAMVKVGISR